MELLARVQIVMWEGGSLWVVDATPAKGRVSQHTDLHAHHAIQVTVSLGGSFRLDTDDTHACGEAVVVAADAQHMFEAEGLVALLFIEPESRAGRAVDRRHIKDRQLTNIPPDILGDFCERVTAAFSAAVRDDAALVALGRKLLAALGADTVVNEPDFRIRKVIRWAAREIDEPIGLSDAVGLSDLSLSRLRHLFVEETGLPFKTYLLWLRLTRAVEGVAAGVPLTQAAHNAGFSDSAHLSRTFRRMFGVAPSGLRML